MKKIFLVIPLLAVVLMGNGCDLEDNATGGHTAKTEQSLTEENQQRLLDAQPPAKLKWSLERDNLNRRTLLWNDENKVSYIYLINYGKVMAFYVIKGKVSSVNSQITNPEQIVDRVEGDVVISSPAEDGSYGTNGNAIFFFDTNGVYYEWAGDYLLVDQPMQLATPPEIVRMMK